jgi:glycosyltransferase involved in cell wall biosynthesis
MSLRQSDVVGRQNSETNYLSLPTFTVVTPNYNMGRYLAETIESVLRNLQPGDEYYVIDGGSQDDSVAVIRAHEKRLTGWVSEPDQGYAHAISKGLTRSNGDLQCWVNSGDLMLDGALDFVRSYFSRSDAEFIFGDDYYIDEGSRVIFQSHGGMRSLKNMMLFGGWTPLQDACYWRRSLYEKVGGIDPAYRYAADFELFLKFAMQDEGEYVPTAFSAFRQHGGQKSRSGVAQYEQEKKMATHKHAQRCGFVGFRYLPLKFGYAAWCRLRARIFQHFWNSRAKSGVPVSTLHLSGSLLS